MAGWTLLVCNDFARQIEWEAYCQAMAAAELGLPALANPAQLPRAEDIRVNDTTPIMRAAGNAVELAPMVWGFEPGRAGGAPVFNFRSERRSFAKSKRCLVPASAFFEFTGKQTPKTKWRFEFAKQPMLAIAGLWREGDADGIARFTMLTTEPGPDVRGFHDRQVAVLRPNAWGAWLYLEKPEAEILQPLPAGSLRVSLARAGREPPAEELLARAGQGR
jgi:putative SOS response-associated peptidase YedK